MTAGGGSSLRAAVVTIGNFDGVHLGHQYMLRQVAERARALGVVAAAVTFDPDPQVVLRPDVPSLELTALDARLRLMRGLGLDDIWVCAFTRELSRLEPAEFIDLVSQRWRIAELWVGADFALGRDRSGTIGVLARLGSERGWALHTIPPFKLDGRVVSSSHIRDLIARGDLDAAERLLGRPYQRTAPSERTTAQPGR